MGKSLPCLRHLLTPLPVAFSYKTHNGVMFATVYEEASAVTALAWNPNLHVGGWAAAGMGSGLVRIEDLAI